MKSKFNLILYTFLVAILLHSLTLTSFAVESGDILVIGHRQTGKLEKQAKKYMQNAEKITTLKITAAVEFNFKDWDFISNLNDRFPNLQNLIVTGGGVREIPHYIFDQDNGLDNENNFPKLKSIQMTDVHTVKNGAFRGCAYLEYVDFPEVLDVGDFAFRECKSLNYVNMPKVRNLNSYAFTQCISLTKIYMPKLNVVGEHAFIDCVALMDVYIPTATYIGDFAFSGCSRLKNINMANVETISEGAFGNCNSLGIAIMPKVTQIGIKAFAFCDQLENYVFGSEVPVIMLAYPTKSYTLPVYHVSGNSEDFEDFEVDADHYPQIEEYDIVDISDGDIFSMFSGHRFEETMSYDEYLRIDLTVEYVDDFSHKAEKSGWYSHFVYDPKVIFEFCRYMATNP